MKNKCLMGICYAKVWAAFTIFWFLTVNLLHAQKFSTVTGLAFNGKSAGSVKVSVFPPGNGGNLTEISIGYKMFSGTKMIIPANTIVLLQSPGGKQRLTPTEGKPIVYSVDFTTQGENHFVKGFGAQIANTVNKTIGYNYRNTNEKGTTAASKGTEFTYTDFSNGKDEKASIVTTEGTINIIDKVPCSVNGVPVKTGREGGVATKSVSQTQSAGSSEFTSSNEPLNYSSLNDAVNYIKNEINSGETDPEDIADDLMCLGDLYMDMEQPDNAVKPYSDAANYYENEYGDDDLYTLEAKISLANAYIGINKNEQGIAIIEESIKLLENNLSFDEDDLEFAKQNNDTEAQEFLCNDIADICGYLGWAYDIANDENKSKEYYDRADAACE